MYMTLIFWCVITLTMSATPRNSLQTLVYTLDPISLIIGPIFSHLFLKCSGKGALQSGLNIFFLQ